MGDYNKLIVSCTVKGEIKEELKTRIDELRLCESAYQSQEHIVSIQENHLNGSLKVIIIGQTKYGFGQSEFCDWLNQYVVQGSGQNDVFALSFSEYSDGPTVWKKK